MLMDVAKVHHGCLAAMGPVQGQPVAQPLSGTEDDGEKTVARLLGILNHSE